MWLKILIISGLIYSIRGREDVLSQLYGVEGRNKVLLCLKRVDGRQERSCTGAIVHEEWVAVHAACVREHPRDSMFTLRVTDTRNCSDLTNGYSTPQTRAVNAYFYHPWWDLAIVMINRPYLQLDVHPNSTMWTVSRTLKQHGLWRWMRRYIKAFGVHRDPEYHYKRIEAHMISTKAPAFAFFFGILLPPLILVLMFLYIINYTGNSNEILYKTL